MRLTVKRDEQVVNEFRFATGPISIGRQNNNQVVLNDEAVSRQHAVIFTDQEGKWIVEDKKSANKTYLNDKPIDKAEIKTGDCLRITDYSIEINLDEAVDAGDSRMEDTLNLEAALTTPQHETVVRKPDAAHAPAMRLPARRLTDFSRATETICEAKNFDELLLNLLDITLEQFEAFRVWCALRDGPSGPMKYHAGKKRNGQPVQLDELPLSEKINQAVEKGQFLVLPRVSARLEEKERIRSALIAAIMRPTGCFGVLYVDNAMIQEHYSLSDLDYLMFLAMHTAAVMKDL
ncbi:MAG: FHA domain-containing protein [Planctomycetota bacterium]|jgi:pSer/pThr/pTyr-binding forkhead associated (FHA) protein